jgi:hypothetical protein
MCTISTVLVDCRNLKNFLPPECEAANCPVCLLIGVYDPLDLSSKAETFFEDLEADLLLECCKFGKILRICTPQAKELEGCIALTFHVIEAAENCAASLRGRWFGGKQLQTHVYPPAGSEVETTAG